MNHASNFEKAKLTGHARGLVFLRVTTRMLKVIWPERPAANLAQYNNGALPFRLPMAPQGSTQNVQNFYDQCRKISRILTDICAAGNGWCVPSIDPLWKKRYLKGIFSRTYELTLAFSTFFPGPPVNANQRPNSLVRPQQNFHCVGIASHDTAHSADRRFQNAAIEGFNTNKELLILDIVCAKNGAPGVATTLMNYVLTEQFKRVSRGAPKYQAAYIYPVHSGNPPVAADAPLLGVVARLGFVPVALQAVPARPDEYNARILRRDSAAFDLQLDHILQQHLPAGVGPLGTHQPCPIGKANGRRKCV